jgi:hypothetical protein
MNRLKTLLTEFTETYGDRPCLWKIISGKCKNKNLINPPFGEIFAFLKYTGLQKANTKAAKKSEYNKSKNKERSRIVEKKQAGIR